MITNDELIAQIAVARGMADLYLELQKTTVEKLKETKDEGLGPIDLRLKIAYLSGQADLSAALYESMMDEIEKLTKVLEESDD